MAATTSTSSSSNPYIDSSLAHFTSPNFSPSAFLNATLPPLHRSTNIQTDSAAVGLIQLSTQVQSLITQLSAQNARLSGTLTTLTDEIIRGGSRLAYEVEVLRGVALGLEETLVEKLSGDIRRFVPDGVIHAANALEGDMKGLSIDDTEAPNSKASDGRDAEEISASTAHATSLDPEYLRQLRTLISVRSRLESVIKIFGDAMAWPLPPPEDTSAINDSFISMSGSMPIAATADSRAEQTGVSEEDRKKAEEYNQTLRIEVTSLLSQKHVNLPNRPTTEEAEESGIGAAQARINQLRQLASIFAGTAEERPRLRVVEELQGIVDKWRAQIDESKSPKPSQGPSGARAMLSGWSRSLDSGKRSSSAERQRPDGIAPHKEESVGTGLLRNLARLRDEIYME
ncbi:hypothetical protein KEM54_003318 [Ascosphaera aggregata]|nr:hypothetical protein KEM54_003318 [Ascosphaera aggregata]